MAGDTKGVAPDRGRRRVDCPRRARIAMVGCLMLTPSIHAQEAPEAIFDPSFLPGDGAETLDLSRFAHGNPVLPGHYDVDIWMNGEWQARESIRFAATSDGANAHPCIDHAALVSYGLAPGAPIADDDDPCMPLEARLPSASSRMDVSEQRLDIDIPQAFVLRRRPHAVSPSQWEQGVTAGLLAWRASARQVASRTGRRQSVVLAADTGVNIGAWRLRQAGLWSAKGYLRRHAYVERQVDAWRSQLRLGDIPVSQSSFSPLRLHGVSIASDARMAPDALGGYAPPVRGFAGTHATVRIRQHGVVIRELDVPPGPFVIDDLYTASRAGDLDVEVDERDGQRQTFRVPFFPVPDLLREGRTTYAVSAGRSVGLRDTRAAVVDAGWRHGFVGQITSYAGLRHTHARTSLLMGAARGTRVGAFSLDVTGALWPSSGTKRWNLRHGRSWRDDIVVSVGLALGQETSSVGRYDRRASTERRRIDVLVQADLGANYGYLSVTAAHAALAHGEGDSAELALSWARSWQRMSMDLSVRASRRRGSRYATNDAAAQLNVSVPLGGSPSTASLHATLHGGPAAAGTRVGVHGTTGARAETTYGVAIGSDRQEGGRIDGSWGRRFGAGEINVAFDRTSALRSTSFSAAGGLVVHGGGITPTHRIGDAVGLVRAAQAHGAHVGGSGDVRVGRSGYAVVPYLMPYRWNAVDLDPSGTSLDVGFTSTHRQVAPTAGAVVLVPFETEVARTVLVTVSLADGKPVPFGAEVLDRSERSVGIVGQGGRVFLRSDEGAGPWTIRWSDGATTRCALRWSDADPRTASSTQHNGVCE